MKRKQEKGTEKLRLELPVVGFKTFITILRIQKFTLMMKYKQFYLKMGSNKLIELLEQPTKQPVIGRGCPTELQELVQHTGAAWRSLQPATQCQPRRQPYRGRVLVGPDP